MIRVQFMKIRKKRNESANCKFEFLTTWKFCTIQTVIKLFLKGDLWFFKKNLKISGDHVLVWRKGNNVLSAGPMKVVHDPRFSLIPAPISSSSGSVTSRLELRDVEPQDAGDFVCQV